jgi:hypothetical protein
MIKGNQNVTDFCPLTEDLEFIGIGVKYTKKGNTKQGETFDGLKQNKLSK